MELRTAASPRDVKHYTTERLREEFLIDDLFLPDVIKLVYSHIDRIMTGSAVPVKETLKLTACAADIDDAKLTALAEILCAEFVAGSKL